MAGFLSRLFGGGDAKEEAAAPEEYKGYAIAAVPKQDGSQWLTAGRITKEIDGETKTHDFIRADRHGDKDSAATFSLTKARQIIDEQGDTIFRTR
ncbi:hypothetical protein MNBD_ALPHA09-1425 [hydrothermal vent metagenome]|uniref:Transcriptional activator HlyU n=1 Tax=hydrothermal vent metagenome TaxID=652676 RepID=A0A3B0U848_9ZZZZ